MKGASGTSQAVMLKPEQYWPSWNERPKNTSLSNPNSKVTLPDHLGPVHLSDWAVTDRTFNTAIFKFISKKMQG